MIIFWNYNRKRSLPLLSEMETVIFTSWRNKKKKTWLSFKWILVSLQNTKKNGKEIRSKSSFVLKKKEKEKKIHRLWSSKFKEYWQEIGKTLAESLYGSDYYQDSTSVHVSKKKKKSNNKKEERHVLYMKEGIFTKLKRRWRKGIRKR